MYWTVQTMFFGFKHCFFPKNIVPAASNNVFWEKTIEKAAGACSSGWRPGKVALRQDQVLGERNKVEKDGTPLLRAGDMRLPSREEIHDR
jgi:hypothetical protein